MNANGANFFFSFLWDWGLNSGLHACKVDILPLEHTSSTFFSVYFGDGVSRTVHLSWPQIATLLISASQITRIIGMSHQCSASVVNILS
jgi:hypothetical protein